MLKALVVAVLVFVVIGVVAFMSMKKSPETEPISKDLRLEVPLQEQNNSGQNGIVTLVPVDDALSVTVEIASVSDELQPAHIHKGTCENIGEVVKAIPFPRSGFAEGDVNVTLKELKSMGPVAINVHKSESEPNVYVACGDIVF